MQFSPSSIGCPSAITHAPNKTRHPRPTITSPQTVALGATYAEASIIGSLPRCLRIISYCLSRELLPLTSTRIHVWLALPRCTSHNDNPAREDRCPSGDALLSRATPDESQDAFHQSDLGSETDE